MRRRLNGVGAYPTDPYFDPDRPGWMPYWLDTPTESVRKFSGYSPSVDDLRDRQIERIAKTDPEAAAAVLAAQAEQAKQRQTRESWIPGVSNAIVIAFAAALLLLLLSRRTG